jgi:hypothetical protein
MPPFLARLPLLGGMLRGVSVRAVVRVLEDLEVAQKKARPGGCWGPVGGLGLDAQACAEFEKRCSGRPCMRPAKVVVCLRLFIRA